ncbi:biotin-dependent carboxyltransferase family protein [Tamlana sp. 2_MG-2023]|uniref:5-oxoprolinase subunit C family protein n=1 Tax=unclassified Tamlana TaxID=2614803 RepID=UPI0026E13DB3|nr:MULTISPECIES: biotin-dependent carboxyltransferase family protein [unclassified Tamlana]MDO6758860.1 biotin-dependent carboxyltransferase family protein [Tamlana sp. 2_MG-2023]MDO6789559.1 biotin-dependent carboxyltransferase family protein [Tamlana sp. 1_MG-2023]
MIKVLKHGFYSTIQDLGRFGVQEFGVPYSGAMDPQALKLANALLGNDENSAVLEMTMVGAQLEFQCDTFICISGASMQPKVNRKKVPTYKLLKINAGDILSFSAPKIGFRTYLAVKGGFQGEVVLGSRSMYLGVTPSAVIKNGDELSIHTYIDNNFNHHAVLKVNHEYFNKTELLVNKGPEFDLLSKAQQKKLTSFEFSISSHNNRMAYQLEELLENSLEAIITSPVLPGTVQLTPSGKLIVLMRDCQTTGGYPRVLQLKSSSIELLSQKYTGQTCNFKLDH